MQSTTTTSWWAAEPGVPLNLPAERAVLGAMLLSHDAVAVAVAAVHGADFADPAHGLIFNAIRALYSHGEPTDVVAATDQLLKTGDLERAGGTAYIHTLTSEVTTASNADYFASLVADAAALRTAVTVGEHVRGAARSGAVDAADVLWWAAEQIHVAMERLRNDHRVPLAVAIDATVDFIESARGHDLGSAEVQTRFAGLDEVTGGLRPGELTVIAGGAGAGKSMLAIDFARAASIAQARPVALFSLELAATEISARIMSAEAEVPLADLRRGRLDTRAWSAVAATRQQLAAAPLHIDDRMTLSVDDIRISARQLMSTGGLRLVIVDHIQLLREPDVARQLKVLSRECRVPVVAVSQLSRDTPAPALSDVPADVAQNADAVILIHDGQLVLAKHRHGPVATFAVERQGHLQRFVDAPRRSEVQGAAIATAAVRSEA